MTGYLALPRAVLETEWWKAATLLTRNLWLVLYGGANWKPGKTRQGEQLDTGQLVTSWRDLACRCSWIENKRRVEPAVANIRRAASFLKSAGEVAWTATGCRRRTGILVTLVNWALYANGLDTAADTAADTTARGSAGTAAPLEEELQGPAASRPAKSRAQRQAEAWLHDGWEGVH